MHEHAQFNGIEASVEFHGRDVIQMAADGGGPSRELQVGGDGPAGLGAHPHWAPLEYKWDQEAEFEIESFIEEHAADFFVDE